MEITAELLNTLAQKVDQLDLSGDERMVLDTVLARAAMSDDEVSGFSMTSPLTGLNPLGRSWGAALGMLGSPGTGATLHQYGDPSGGPSGGPIGDYGRLPGT